MCGFVLYDTQLIIEKRRMGNQDFVQHALELFIDFIGIFRRLVIILTQKVKKEKNMIVKIPACAKTWCRKYLYFCIMNMNHLFNIEYAIQNAFESLSLTITQFLVRVEWPSHFENVCFHFQEQNRRRKRD